VNTVDLITALEDGHTGYHGADVYEDESEVFTFYDYSDKEIKDPMLKKLLSMPNLLVTPHQAVATQEVPVNIATTNFEHIDCWENGQDVNKTFVRD
jgi:D-lactate dehydrogenase